METNNNNNNNKRSALEVALNKEAVFAQLDLNTTGTAYDESIELFRKDSARRKTGVYKEDLSFCDLEQIAKDLFNERKRVYSIGPVTHGLTDAECGEYAGFTIRLLFDGGVKSHFDIDAAGEISEEFEGWLGHEPLTFLDDDESPAIY